MIWLPPWWSTGRKAANVRVKAVVGVGVGVGVRVGVVLLAFVALACSGSVSEKTVDSTALEQRSVRITTSGCGYANKSTGSGFLLTKNQVLTAAHVIGRAKTIEVDLDGTGPLKAEAIAYDPARDLAIVQFPINDSLSVPLPAPVLKTMASGQTGHIIGAQSQDRIEFEVIEKTIIQVDDGNTNDRSRRSGYLLRASTAPGDSGAPLFNHQGDLVGLLFAVSTNDKSRSWAVAGEEIEAFLGDPTVEGRFVCDRATSKLKPTG